MALHQPSPQCAAGRTPSLSIQQREEAATARERSLAGEVERVSSLKAATQEQLNGQRRSAPRVELVAAVDFQSEHNFYSGFSSDLSSGGLFVTTCENAPIGTHINLKFSIPGGIEIEAEGEVRWVREISDVQPEMLAGVGVSFTRIAPESVRAIEAFIAERDPMFFPDA